MTISLTINGQPVEVSDGASVLGAINASGTYISQLCKDPDMKAIGACRTCLVQVEGTRGFPASCSLPAQPGMAVSTESDEVRRLRAGVIELTWPCCQPPRHRVPPLSKRPATRLQRTNQRTPCPG